MTDQQSRSGSRGMAEPRLSVEQRHATPCRKGHSRLDAFVIRLRNGLVDLQCRICHAERARKQRAAKARGETP
jgi:hypothetical protein